MIEFNSSIIMAISELLMLKLTSTHLFFHLTLELGAVVLFSCPTYPRNHKQLITPTQSAIKVVVGHPGSEGEPGETV